MTALGRLISLRDHVQSALVMVLHASGCDVRKAAFVLRHFDARFNDEALVRMATRNGVLKQGSSMVAIGGGRYEESLDDFCLALARMALDIGGADLLRAGAATKARDDSLH